MKVGARSSSLAGGITVGLALGLLIELPTVMAAVTSGGAGHGDYIAARALFPWSLLLTPLQQDKIGAFSIAVGLLQFPTYGALLGWSVVRKIYLTAVVVVLAHITAALVCFVGTLPNFS